MASINLLIKRKALERLSIEQSDYSKDCHKAMSFLFSHISSTAKATLDARYSTIDLWRNEAKLVNVWSALHQTFGMVNTVFPKVMKIRAESSVIGPEEDIGAFLVRKEAMLLDVRDHGVPLAEEDFTWSLIFGLSFDHRLRLFLEPYYTFKIYVPKTYEAFKAELNTWTLAQDRLDTRGAGKKTRDEITHTAAVVQPKKNNCKYCHKMGHSEDKCWKKKAEDADRIKASEALSSGPRFKPRDDRMPGSRSGNAITNYVWDTGIIY